MLNKIAKILGLSLLWAMVIGTVAYAFYLRQTHYSELKISKVQIEICDSTSHGQLVTSQMVSDWLDRSGLVDCQLPASQIDLDSIERYIAGNGFVGQVSAIIDFDGVLRVRVGQRDPLFRLLVDGYNHYVTGDGYVFRAPESASLYVPVVSGSYRPPFESDYEGNVEAKLQDFAADIEQRIADLEPERYPYYKAQRDNRDYNRQTNRMFIKQRVFESDSAFEARVVALKEHKYERRRHYRYQRGVIQQELARIDGREQALREEQKKMEKKVKDFQNLITFVKRIEKSELYRSQIVQLLASDAHSGALEVGFVPRCGEFVVRLGRLEGLDQKFERWEQFCNVALSHSGWEGFSEVSLEYEDRVVCRLRSQDLSCK